MTLTIRLTLGIPYANNLHRLAKYRRELAGGQFAGLMNDTSGDPNVVEAIASLLDQLDRSDSGMD